MAQIPRDDTRPSRAILFVLLAALVLPVGHGCKSASFDRPASAPASGFELSADVTDILYVVVPDGAREIRCWFETPLLDEFQVIHDLQVKASYPTRTVTDPATGNRFLYLEAAPPFPEEIEIVQTFGLRGRERHGLPEGASSRPLTWRETERLQPWLKGSRYVTVTPEVEAWAAELAGDLTDPIAQARTFHQGIVGRVEYWKKDRNRYKPSGVGSTEYALQQCQGNCTDFHALFLSLCRCRGIPARFIMGSVLAPEKGGADEDAAYHCWAEFYAPDFGWVPVDSAFADFPPVGDGFPEEDPADFYFGNLDARRIAFSRGRDVALTPPSAEGRLNYFQYAHVEVDGKTSTRWERKLTFRERPVR